jgi:hypothetical protein
MNIIFTLHAVFLVCLIIIPFLNNERWLQTYSLIIPFIFYHWSVNDDTCAMTQLETYMTGKNKDETFFHRLVSPVYKMDDTAANNLLKSTLFFLWMFTQYRLERFKIVEDDLKKILAKYRIKKY